MPQIMDLDTNASRQAVLASKFDRPNSGPSNAALPNSEKSTEPRLAGKVDDDNSFNIESLENTAAKPAGDEGGTDTATVEPTEAVFDIPNTGTEDPAGDEGDETPEPTAAPAGGVPAGARDYKSFPEEIVPVLKALNNTQFKKWAPKLKELHAAGARAAELETKLADAQKGPRYFYEHPDAFRITPEYRKIEEDIQYATFEEQHWADQLQAIMAGQAWKELTGYQGGQPVLVERPAAGEGKVDHAAQVRVQQLLNQTSGARMQLNGRLQGIQQQYASNAANAKTELATISATVFPKLKSEADMSEEDKKHFALARKIAPPYFADHPLVDQLGKSFVMYMRLAKQMQELVKERDTWKAKAQGRTSGEPTVRPGGGGARRRVVDDVVNIREYEND